MRFVNLNDFFKEFTVNEQITSYETVKYFLKILDAVSRASGQSLYVIDYYKKGFLYVSSNPLFLCGYSAEEVTKMGYLFYEKILPPEDLNMLLEINQKGFSFFYKQPIEDRIKFTISYDFRLIQQNKRTTMVNHKLTPIMLTPQGDIWLALCVVSLSSQTEPGNVFINKDGVLQRYSYSFMGKKWKESEIITLSEREKEVLQFSTQGFSNEQIAETICIDVNTVKFHKKKVFQKFNVKNITEAIIFAHNNNLL